MIRVESVYQERTKFPEEFRKAIISFLDRVSGVAREEAVAKAPHNRGQLQNNISIIREHQHPVFRGGIQSNLPYAVVQEEGRTPGKPWPPHEAIERWVWLNRGKFGEVQIGKNKSGPVKHAIGSSKKGKRALKSLTFLVRRKIGKKGFEGKHFFRAAASRVEREFQAQIDALGIMITKAWESTGDSQ